MVPATSTTPQQRRRCRLSWQVSRLTLRRNAAHLDIVRERHPSIVIAVKRGGHPALVRICQRAGALGYQPRADRTAGQRRCAWLCDARGRAGRCPRCASKLHLVCSPSDLQPNEPVRLECRQWQWNKGGYTCGASFKRCGWQVAITPRTTRAGCWACVCRIRGREICCQRCLCSTRMLRGVMAWHGGLLRRSETGARRFVCLFSHVCSTCTRVYVYMYT